MIFKIRSLVLFLTLVFLAMSSTLLAQKVLTTDLTKAEQKAVTANRNAVLSSFGGKLKGFYGTIPTLKATYCSNENYDDILTPISAIPGTSLIWQVITVVAGEGSVDHFGDWAELIDVAGVPTLRFYPSRVDDAYHNVAIAFNYYYLSPSGVAVGAGGDECKVFKTPTAFNFGSDGAVCSGSSLVLTLESSESGIRYTLLKDGVSASVPGNPINGANGVPITFNVSAAGVYTVNGELLDGSNNVVCSNLMNGLAVVTVNPIPVLTVTPGSSICAGESVNLSVSGDQDPNIDYVWSTGATSASISVSPVTTTTYNVVGTNRITGCAQTASVTVTVNPVPVASIVNPSPVCAGQLLELSANILNGTGPYVLTWTRPDLTTFVGPVLSLSPAQATHSGTYTLRVTDMNGCGSSVVSTQVVVNDLPIANINASPSGPVCSGTPITFTASGGTLYTFKVNNAVVQGPSANFVFVYTLPQQGDLVTVDVENASGCSSTTFPPITLQVNALPVPTLSVAPSATVCEGTELVFTAGGGSTYQYFINGVAVPGGFTANAELRRSNLVTGDVVTVAVRNANGCQAISNGIVITIQKPITTLTSNPANATVCSNQSIVFTATGGVQYEFYVNNMVRQALGASATYTTNSLVTGDVVTVRVVDALGCEAMSAGIPVVVNSLPIVTLNSAPAGGVCIGGSITYTASGVGVTSFTFYVNGFAVQGPSAQATFVYNNPVNGALVSVTGMNANGCESSNFPIPPVIVFPDFTPTLTGLPASPICEGTGVTFTAGGGVLFQFRVNGVNQTPGLQASNTFISTALNNGDRISVFVQDANGCQKLSSEVVYTVNNIVASISVTAPAIGNSTVCAGESLTFSAGPAGSANYEFMVTRGGIDISLQNGPSATYTSTVFTNGDQIFVRVTGLNGCTDVSDKIPVKVVSNPVVDFTFSPALPICENQPVTITATPGFSNYRLFVNSVQVSGPQNSNVFAISTLKNGDLVVVAASTLDGTTECGAASPPKMATLNPIPVIVLTSNKINDSVCQGTPIVFTLLGGITYEYAINGGPRQPVVGNSFTLSSLLNGDRVTAYGRSASGCEGTDELVVTVTSATATLVSDDADNTVCVGQSIVFTASGGVSYEFFVDGISQGAPSATTTYLYVAPAIGVQTVMVRATDANGCIDDSPAISVRGLGLPIASLFVNQPFPVCAGTPLIFTAGGGITYSFFVNNVLVQGPSNDNTFESSTLIDGDQVSVLVANNNNCESSSLPIVAQITPLPDVTLSASKSTGVCVGEDVTFTVNSAQVIVSYTYYISQGGVTTTVVSNSPSYVHTASADFSVYVEVTDANGCKNTSATQDISVVQVTAGLSASRTVVCIGELVDFTATGGSLYEFFVDGISQGAPSANPVFNYFATSPGNVNVSVEAISAEGCVDSHAGILLLVNNLPFASLQSSDADGTICALEGVTFTGLGGEVYEFFVNNVSVQGPSPLNTFTQVFAVGGVYQVRVDVSFAATGCTSSSLDYSLTVVDLPNATLSRVPAGDIVEGNLVTFTAGEAGNEYQFLVNGIEVQARSTNPVYSTTLLQDGDVVAVNVYNANNCVSTATQTITVFDGIQVLQVTPPAAAYCDGEAGIRIEVINPQNGITYRLRHVESNTLVSTEITFDSSVPTPVAWNNVTIVLPSNPSTFAVEAYYNLIPDQVVEMGNRVVLTRNQLPAVYQLLPYNGTQTGCTSVPNLTLSGSELNVTYDLLLDHNSIGISLPGTGNALDFGSFNFVGIYSVQARQTLSGCSLMMDGTFTVVGESVQTFNLVANPSNGVYCETEQGVQIGLSGSEVGMSYWLYRNGVSTGQILAGTSAALDFGYQTIDGVYAIFTESATGCLYPGNGQVTVTTVALPTQYIVNASNGGAYCDGEAGVEISVSGQQNGIVYSLWLNGVRLAGTDIVGGVTDVPFTFNGFYTTDGVYSVLAESPLVACSSSMLNTVTVVKNLIPTGYLLLLSPSVICADDVATLTVLGSLRDVEYTLFIQGQPLPIASKMGTGGAIDFPGLDVSGTYFVTARNILTGCAFDSGESVLLDVRNRPYVNEDLQHFPATSTASCTDGDAIEVLNAQMNLMYTLVKNTATGYVSTGRSFIYDGTNNRFDGIRDRNSFYGVVVSYADGVGCDDLIPELIYVDVAGAIEVFELTGDNEICNGDPGVFVSLSGSEVGVDYTLYYEGAPPITIPGTGNALVFSGFELINEGEYYVVGLQNGCTTEMLPRFNFKINPLPTSFEIIGDRFYCDGVGSVVRVLHSELNVTYTLQFVYPDGKKKVIERIQGDGSEIAFSPPSAAGKYIVIALNNLTFCTSNMEGEVVVDGIRSPIDQLVVANPPASCALGVGVVLSLSPVQVDVKYELRNAQGIVVAEAVVADASVPLQLTVRDSGDYTLWGSYSGEGCMVQLNNGLPISILILESPSGKKITSGGLNGCGTDSGFIALEGSQWDVAYTLQVADPSMFAVSPAWTQLGDGSNIRWDIEFNGSGDVEYQILASINGACETTLATIQGSYKGAPAVFSVADTMEYCASEGGRTIELPAQAELGVYYRLFEGDFNNFVTGIEVTAANRAFNGTYTQGEYFVEGVSLGTGCRTFMSDTIKLVEHANPIADYNFYYQLDSDSEPTQVGQVAVGSLIMDASETGIHYQLFAYTLDGQKIAVADSVGTGNPINFGPMGISGQYFIEAIDAATGCASEISDRVLITQTPLEALNGFLNLKMSDVSGVLDVVQSDPAMILYSVGVDKIYGKDDITDAAQSNIVFELIPEFMIVHNGENKLFTTIGEAKLNAVNGLFEYTKKPGFFGGDSVRYRIYNRDLPERADEGTIFIFAGNNNVDEDNPFLIPNAFSPNGDGINDLFVISLPKFIKADGFRSKLEVFNRWGTLVYQSKGAQYDNNWDGKSTEASMVSIGKDLPSGTYFCVFKITFIQGTEHVSKEISGYIELRR